MGKTQHGSARVLNSEPEARLESSASRFEAERSASGVPETICRDPRARLVATRPRGVNAAIRTRFSPAEDDAVRTRFLNMITSAIILRIAPMRHARAMKWTDAETEPPSLIRPEKS